MICSVDPTLDANDEWWWCCRSHYLQFRIKLISLHLIILNIHSTCPPAFFSDFFPVSVTQLSYPHLRSFFTLMGNVSNLLLIKSIHLTIKIFFFNFCVYRFLNMPLNSTLHKRYLNFTLWPFIFLSMCICLVKSALL